MSMTSPDEIKTNMDSLSAIVHASDKALLESLPMLANRLRAITEKHYSYVAENALIKIKRELKTFNSVTRKWRNK